MNAVFEDFAAQQSHLQALSIQVLPDGRFSCPGEAEGRMAKLSPASLYALANFLGNLAARVRGLAQQQTAGEQSDAAAEKPIPAMAAGAKLERRAARTGPRGGLRAPLFAQR